MKQNISVYIASLLLAGTWSCSRSGEERTQTQTSPTRTEQVAETTTNELPDLTLTKINRSQESARDIKGKAILIYFDPDCDHCQEEAKMMQANMDAFKDYALYFISSAPMAKMQQFAWDYKLIGPNINIAYATNGDILRTFGPVQTPSIYIYSETGKLVKAFNGQTPMEKILPLL
jgi:peroxiredoxin